MDCNHGLSIPKTGRFSPEALSLLIMAEIPLVSRQPMLLGTEDIRKYLQFKTRQKAYSNFEIPKRSGGTRTIMAPNRELKAVLRALAAILQRFWAPSIEVYGFSKGRSVVEGAGKHVGKPYLLNMDLKDFFTSIHLGMVMYSLMRTGLTADTALFIGRLSTALAKDGRLVLPQGAPTSPILSNIACERMDRRIARLAECFGVTYTRFADDLSFSADYNAFKEGDAFRTCLEAIIRDEGFTVNEAKTRLQKRGSRQEVTGLTVSEKVNVSRKWLKSFRADIHRMETRGCTMADVRRAYGKLAWMRLARNGWDPASRKLFNRIWKLESAVKKKEREVSSH